MMQFSTSQYVLNRVTACIGCKRQYSVIICIIVFEVAQLLLHYAEDFYVKCTSYYVTCGF